MKAPSLKPSRAKASQRQNYGKEAKKYPANKPGVSGNKRSGKPSPLARKK